MQAAIDKVTQERDELIKSCRAHNALTSPLWRFPATFIHWCIHPTSYPRPIATQPPLLLCPICSLWCNIAISLWSMISLSVEYPQCPAVLEWLVQSGAHLLCAQQSCALGKIPVSPSYTSQVSTAHPLHTANISAIYTINECTQVMPYALSTQNASQVLTWPRRRLLGRLK
jgi:hypothetical protein